MTALTFEVLGNPKGRVHTQPALNRKTGRAFTRADSSPEQRTWAACVKDAARGAIALNGWVKPEVGAVSLSIEFIMPRPKRFLWKGPHAEPRHCTKPDRNNLEKAIEDALKGIVWADDAQVSEGPVSKRYARPGEICRAIVSIEALGEWYEEVSDGRG